MSSVQISIEDDDPWVISQNIFDILNRFLQPSSSVSADAAARDLIALYPENRAEEEGKQKESAQSFLIEMWRVVLKVAVQLSPGGEAQEKLAALLRTLCDVRPVKTLNIWGTDIRLWQDLPLLGPGLTDEFNAIPGNALFSDHDVWQKDRQRWRSLNAFASRLTRDGFDYSHQARFALSDALEYPLASEQAAGHKADPKTQRSAGPALESVMDAAADWISQCGSAVYERCKKGEGEDGAKGPLWDGTEAYSLGRWKLWERRFGEISKSESLDRKTRDVAAQTARRMEEIESGRT